MSNLMDHDLIFLQEKTKSYTEVLKTFGEVMIRKGYANEDYIEGLLGREEEFATGVPAEPIGVAIPHTDSSFVKENKIGLMTLAEPVEFGLMGGSAEETIAVKLVILIGISNGEQHLKALQTIIELIQDPSFVEQLVSVSKKEEAFELLEQKLTTVIEEEKI